MVEPVELGIVGQFLGLHEASVESLTFRHAILMLLEPLAILGQAQHAEFRLVSSFDVALRNAALFSQALEVLFQTGLISVIREAGRILSRNDAEFSNLG